VRAPERGRAHGEWTGNVRRGRVHDGVRGRKVREGQVADKWGPRASKSGLANARSALTGRTHRAARENGRARGNRRRQSGPPGSGRERACARTRALADRWYPPVRRRGRTRGLAGLG
jgi:hypothetical protein